MTGSDPTTLRGCISLKRTPGLRRGRSAVVAGAICLVGVAAGCSGEPTAPTTAPPPPPPLTLESQGGFADSVVWSPDGARLATDAAGGSQAVSGVTQIWDTATGTIVHTVDGHDAAWFPDGTRLVTSDFGLGTVWIWDAATGEPIHSIEIDSGLVVATLPSPDGSLLAVVEGTPGQPTTRIWDTATGELSRTIGPVWAKSWSPDGGRLLTAAYPDAQVWGVATGQPVATLRDAFDYAVVWSPDGTRVAAASSDHTVGIWDAATGERVGGLTGHADEVMAVVWSPDGGRIATATYLTDEVQIWDAATGQVIQTVAGVASPNPYLAFSPDATRLAAFHDDSMSTKALVWHTTSGALLTTLTSDGTTIYDLAWSPDGTRVATTHDNGTIRIWTVTAG